MTTARETMKWQICIFYEQNKDFCTPARAFFILQFEALWKTSAHDAQLYLLS